jgi:hypothetical protein
MLKLFFNRNSPFVYLMNAIALVEALLLLFRGRGGDPGFHLGWLSCYLIFSWLFFNALNLFPWYSGFKGKLGIRLHFQKNLVPVVYLSALAFALKLMGVSDWVLSPIAVLYLPMYYVALILLWFHFRDESELTPGYFTHNFYLQNEENS